MSQKSVLIAFSFALMLLVILGVSDAKRVGCASFGHSCYGGHGKRSDLQFLTQDVETSESQQQQQPIFRALQVPPRRFPIETSLNDIQVLNENEKELKLMILNMLRDSVDEIYRKVKELEAAVVSA